MAVVLLIVVIATAIFSFLQEAKASKAAAGFASMAPPQATVIRGGKKVKIEATEIVVGDLLKLKAGDKIAGDIIVISSQDMKVRTSLSAG